MHQARIAAFLNQKGGVGKTTSVVNVGSALAILGKKVLIVDLDPQGHLTTFLGIEQSEGAPTIYDVFRGTVQLKDAIVEQKLGARMTIAGQDSALFMSVLPANLKLAGVEPKLSQRPDAEFLLRDALRKVSADYDYILIDCPPSLGLVSTNALHASQQVFIPVQTEFLAFESLESLLERVESIMDNGNPDLHVGGIIATRFDGRKVINRKVVQDLRERFGMLLLNTMIRENIVLAESPSVGKDIFTYRPRSNGAADYLNLALEIMGQITADESPITVERGGVITRHEQAQFAS